MTAKHRDQGNLPRLTLPLGIRVLVSVFLAAAIVIHAVWPGFVIDHITIALLLLIGVVWLLPWIRSFEGAGIKVDFDTSPPSVPEAKATLEIDQSHEAVHRGLAFGVTVSNREYLQLEDVALAAVTSSLLPGWVLLPRQRVFMPDGAFEDVDALVRGPSGYRDTIIEMRLYLASKTPEIARQQIADFNNRASTLIARSGRSYQPVMLWVAPEPVQPTHAILAVVEGAVASTGIYIGLFVRTQPNISYAPAPPIFVDAAKAQRLAR